MKWNKDEIEKLKESYATVTIDELLELFPNRTLPAIIQKAYYLRLNRSD